MNDGERTAKRPRELIGRRTREVDGNDVFRGTGRRSRVHDPLHRPPACLHAAAARRADESVRTGHDDRLPGQNHFQPCFA
jgi:hypothetical protein